MQSFLHGALLHDSGYFHVWISSVKDVVFFNNSEDKAFFMTLIQDNLSPRGKLAELNVRMRGYSSEIDLLAYSLTETGVHLLVHTSRKTAIEELGQALLIAYQTYAQQQTELKQLPFDTIFIFDKLRGRHEALHVSREIHLLHDEWRYDRYSSIGFYLDDRRGDWMRPYRLTSLFNAKPKQYLRFMKSQETESDRVFEYLET
ncbi:MAG TPA: hypothetical protein VIM31_04560 [Candidatus Microsaccharimonas sp.]|jgi:hypothetical protein